MGPTEPRHDQGLSAPGIELSGPAGSESVRTVLASEHDHVSEQPPAALPGGVTRATFDVGEAIWVEGRIVFPAGTPADEEVVLLAVGFESRSPRIVKAHTHAVLGLLEMPDGSAALVEVQADGSFRAPFCEGSRSGALHLIGRYIFLEPSVGIAVPSDSPVVLEPELGGRFTGRLVLPPGQSFDRDAFAERGDGPRVHTWRGWTTMHSEIARLDEELCFEFGGLRSGPTYGLSLNPVTFGRIKDMNLHVRPGEHIDRVYELEAGAAVAGTCLDEAGQPYAGLRVMALGLERQRQSETTTGPDGRFRVEPLTPGNYQLVILRGEVWETTHELEHLRKGEVRDGLQFRIPRGSELVGHVGWPDGEAAGGASVVVLEVSDRQGPLGYALTVEHRTETDERGAFRVEGLGRLPLHVRAEARLPADGDEDALPWRATAAVVEGGTNVSLTLAAPITITGQVLQGDGEPIARFRVSTRELRNAQPQTERTTSPPRRSVRDADGRFQVALHAGQWRVSVSAKGFSARFKDIEVPLVEPLPAFVLQARTSLVGSVVDPDGRPLPHATMVHRAAEMGLSSREVTTDDQGRFALDNLHAQSLVLTAKAPGFADSEELVVELVPGTPSEDVVLTVRRAGRLRGRAYAADGSPASGLVTVNATKASATGSALRLPQTRTDEAGRFEIYMLAPGRYVIYLEPDRSKSAGSAVDLLAGLRAAGVEIRAGETTEVVLGEPPNDPARVTGRVTSAGVPVAGTGLFFVASGGGLSLDSIETGDDGQYEILLEGGRTYSVEVSMGWSTCGFVRAIPATVTHRLDLELPEASVHGNVVDADGSPVHGLFVQLVSEEGVIPPERRTVETDARGRFDATNLVAATYSVRAGVAFGQSSRRMEHGMTTRDGVRVGEGERVGPIELRLSRGGFVSGGVLLPDGSPAANATIYVRTPEGVPLSEPSPWQTDKLGRFEVEGLPPGRVSVSARDERTCSRAFEVTVIAGETVQADLRLLESAWIRVVALDEEQDVPVARVQVFDENGWDHARLRGSETLARLAASGWNADATDVGPLLPGKYRVEVQAADGRAGVRRITLRGSERTVKVRLR